MDFELRGSKLEINFKSDGEKMAFLSILMASKFEDGFHWKFLLNNFTNDLIKGLVDDIYKDNRADFFSWSKVGPESAIYEGVSGGVSEFISSGASSEADREKLISMGMYPFSV